MNTAIITPIMRDDKAGADSTVEFLILVETIASENKYLRYSGCAVGPAADVLLSMAMGWLERYLPGH